MKVNVRLFARYREAAGRDRVEVDLPEGGTVESAWEAVASRFPALSVAHHVHLDPGHGPDPSPRDQANQRLQRSQGLSMFSDQRTQIVSRYLDPNRLGCVLDGDISRKPHETDEFRHHGSDDLIPADRGAGPDSYTGIS